VQFLGIGWQEILLVLVLMLVVVGPERLPTVAYQVGRAVRTLQQYARAVRSEFGDEIGYIEEQYKTVRGEINTTRDTFREQQRSFEAEMREATQPIQDLPQLVSPDQPSNVVNISGRASTTAVADPAPASDPAAEAAAAATPDKPGSTEPPLLF
jgi:sec-independent protein translocase protein TatB